MAQAPAPKAAYWPTIWICAGLAALTCALYAPALRNGFVSYDDDKYVTANPDVQAGLTIPTVAWAFRGGYASNWHPLTWLSHAVDCQIYGLRPWGHHLTNIALHVATTVLLFLLLRRVTGATGRSAFVAALFALHPVHVESVAWVAERKDVLSGLFFVLTLDAYARYVAARSLPSSSKGPRHDQERDGRKARSASFYYWLAVAFCALGLMSKPMLVTLPFVLVLVDYWPLGRFRFERKGFSATSLAQLGREKLPFLLLVIASCAVTLWSQHRGGAMLSLEAFPFGYRFANALVACLRYFGKIFWPERLAVFYPHPITWPGLQVWGAAAVLLAGCAAAVKCARRFPYLFTGWFWFLVMLVPVLGLVQVGSQAMADRYTYLPAIGMFIVLAWGATDLAAAWLGQRWVLAPAAGAAVAICFCLAVKQVRVWESGETLFRHALKVTPPNVVAYHNLGIALNRQQRWQEAAENFEQALRLDPRFFRSHVSLAVALREAGDKEGSARHCALAARLDPQDAQIQNDLANLLDSLGRPEEAVPHYLAALRLEPGFAGAEYNYAGTLATLGRVDEAVRHYEAARRLSPNQASTYYNLALLFARQGRTDEALRRYQEALRLDPSHFGAHLNLANLLFKTGRVSEALEHYRLASQLKPDAPEPRLGLGRLLVAGGDLEQGLREMREALRLRPQWVVAMNELAWVLATNPEPEIRNGAQAVELAEAACDLSGQSQPTCLATLAAAYAETGQFEAAIKAAEAARQLLVSGTAASNLTATLDTQLNLYRARQPFHQPKLR